MSEIIKLEFSSKNVPSFSIDDIKKQYPSILTADFKKLVKVVPKNLPANKKSELLKCACEWFLQDVAIPIIKQQIRNLLKRGIKCI